MARFIGDQSSFAWKYESGTYANESGTAQWAGLVQNSKITEEINKTQTRYVSSATRNLSQQIDLARDTTVTLNTMVQDWRLLGFALGSIYTTGSPYTHTLTEVNSNSSNGFTSGTNAPFISFSAMDAKRFNPTGLNHCKIANGCMINNLTINWAEGEPVTFDVDAVAQNTTYSSGAAWTPTANTERPYIWSDTVMSIPSGTPIRYLKSSSLSVNNNMSTDHYVNGSQVPEMPFPTSRDYEWSINVHANSDQAKAFYETYFRGGSSFNAFIHTAKSSTRYCSITLSGCKIPSMDDPTTFEGGQEMAITIRPTSISAVVVDDIALYGAW